MALKKLAVACGLACLLLPASSSAQESPENQAAIDAARELLTDYMVKFNSRNSEAWASTLNFPHYRFIGDRVDSWEDAEEYARSVNLEDRSWDPWDHSHFIALEVTLAAPEKVHVLTTIRRYSDQHEHLVTFKSLYIVTLQDGRWGVKARSSLAPR